MSNCQDDHVTWQNVVIVKSRLLPIALALATAVLLVLSVQGGRWWVIETAELGPRGARACLESGCAALRLESFGGDIQWSRFGVATWAAGLLTALIALIVGVRVAVRRVPRLGAKTLLVSACTSAITGIGFVMKSPTSEISAAQMASGVWLFALGVLAAATCGVWVLRQRSEPDRPS